MLRLSVVSTKSVACTGFVVLSKKHGHERSSTKLGHRMDLHMGDVGSHWSSSEQHAVFLYDSVLVTMLF